MRGITELITNSCSNKTSKHLSNFRSDLLLQVIKPMSQQCSSTTQHLHSKRSHHRRCRHNLIIMHVLRGNKVNMSAIESLHRKRVTTTISFPLPTSCIVLHITHLPENNNNRRCMSNQVVAIAISNGRNNNSANHHSPRTGKYEIDIKIIT